MGGSLLGEVLKGNQKETQNMFSFLGEDFLETQLLLFLNLEGSCPEAEPSQAWLVLRQGTYGSG